MSERARPRVFVAYSLADDDGRALRHRLAETFDVTAPEMLSGNLPRPAALRQSLIEADVAVVVLPVANDPSRANVIFEAGIAAGVGIPLVIVGKVASVPGDLSDRPTFDFGHLDDVVDAIEQLYLGEQLAVPRSAAISETPPTLSSEFVNNWLRRLQNAQSERDAIPLISELFQRVGARTKPTAAGERTIVDRPDVALWHDEILATFGLPLPVEVLWRSKAWPAVRSRLERTLLASGGRTLLAIVVLDDPAPRVWTDGRRTILLVGASQLAQTLIRLPLASALTTILSSAVP
jgi:hypothetical protein